MNPPNTAQFQLPKDIGHTQDVQTRQAITGTTSGSTDLTTQQLICEVTPPASGVHTANLPPLDQWKNGTACFYQVASAPGGEFKIALKESGADAVGDNLSAANDVVVLLNVQGEKIIVVKDVTT